MKRDPRQIGMCIIAFFGVAFSGYAHADPNPYVTPYELFWCWEESGGSCEPGYGESFTTNQDEIVYMYSYDYTGYDIDTYYITGHHADIEAVAVTLEYDSDEFEPYQGYLYYPWTMSWVVADDWEYDNGSFAGFAEWQSSGDGVPNDWDYDSGYYVARAIFHNTNPAEDDLWVIIYDDDFI